MWEGYLRSATPENILVQHHAGEQTYRTSHDARALHARDRPRHHHPELCHSTPTENGHGQFAGWLNRPNCIHGWLHLPLSQDIQDIQIKRDAELFIFLIHVGLPPTKAYCRFCIVRYLKMCSCFMVSFVLKSPKIPPFEVLDFKISWGRAPRPPTKCTSGAAAHFVGCGCEPVTTMLFVTLLGLSPFLIVGVTVIYKSAGWCFIRLYQSPQVGLCLDLCS